MIYSNLEMQHKNLEGGLWIISDGALFRMLVRRICEKIPKSQIFERRMKAIEQEDHRSRLNITDHDWTDMDSKKKY